MYKCLLSRVLFALTVKKFPTVNKFYTSAAIDASDKYHAYKSSQIKTSFNVNIFGKSHMLVRFPCPKLPWHPTLSLLALFLPGGELNPMHNVLAQTLLVWIATKDTQLIIIIWTQSHCGLQLWHLGCLRKSFGWEATFLFIRTLQCPNPGGSNITQDYSNIIQIYLVTDIWKPLPFSPAVFLLHFCHHYLFSAFFFIPFGLILFAAAFFHRWPYLMLEFNCRAVFTTEQSDSAVRRQRVLDLAQLKIRNFVG